MKDHLKIFMAAAALPCALAGTPLRADGGNAEAASAPEQNAADEMRVYTPARAALRVQEHLITPFYAYYSQRLPSSVSGGGKMASSTYGTGFSWRFVHPEKTRIALTNFNYRRTDYRFSGGRGAPFEHTDSLYASTYQEFINPDTGFALVGMLTGALAAEDGAGLEEGFGGVLAAGCKQYFSETTSLTLGVATLYRFDRERWFCYPFVSFDWRLAPTLNLRLLNGASLTWDVFSDESFLLDFSVNYQTSAFAVARDRDRASAHYGKTGAYYEQSVPVTVTGTWNVSENLFLSVGISLNTWTKYRLYRSGRETDEDFSTAPTLELSLQAGLRF